MEQHSESVGGDKITGNIAGAKNTIVGNHNRQSIREDASDRRQINEISINEFAPSDIQAIYAKLARIEDNINWRMTRLEDNMTTKIGALNDKIEDVERDADYDRRNPPKHSDKWMILNFLSTSVLTVVLLFILLALLRLAH